MSRPDRPAQEIIAQLARGNPGGLSPKELQETRAAIERILRGATPQEVNIATLQRAEAERKNQREIESIRSAHWAWVANIILSFRKDLQTIPSFPDHILKTGDTVPIANTGWGPSAVNLTPVVSRFSNSDAIIQFPTEAGQRPHVTRLEYGGVAEILGFSADKLYALLSYMSPRPEGSLTGVDSPSGIQYFQPVHDLCNKNEEVLEKRKFRAEVRRAIGRISSGQGPQHMTLERGNAVHVGDFARLMAHKRDTEVYVMNLDTIAPLEKHTVYDVFEVHPSPEGVITPADIQAEGERQEYRVADGLSFQELKDLDTIRLDDHCTVKILGFTDNGRAALVEYRGTDFPHDRRIEASLRGIQFFISVQESDIDERRAKREGWEEILFARDASHGPTGRGYYPARFSPLSRTNIYTKWDIGKEYRDPES
ncbi:MAG: hypothetical protein Q7R81_00925 [Candidatus Peregrinibacteria bacterium]|nr:hypothetical protein [Candidatus Peregrinibacteria bacterium]